MTDHLIETAQDLRSRYGEPSENSVRKSLDRLDRHCRRFIELSPFVVLATSGADGRADCSPRGDPPGFVAILDERTVLLPDRRGNNRTDSLRNILENPHVGLLFMIPGANETLRLNGRATLTADPAAARAARRQWTGAAQRSPDRGGRGLSAVHEGARALPAVGGRVAGGPQDRAPVVRTDARRPHRPVRRRGHRPQDPRDAPGDAVLIGEPAPPAAVERRPPPGRRELRRSRELVLPTSRGRVPASANPGETPGARKFAGVDESAGKARVSLRTAS